MSASRLVRRSLLAGCALAGILSAGVARAHPHSPIAVKIDPQDAKHLLVLDQGAATPRTLYRTSADAVVGAAVSPYFSRVAVLEARGAKNRLVVVDIRGRTLRELDRDVRKLVFSPNGRGIAFLTGSHFEGGAGFLPDGAAILDVDSGRIEEIPGAERAYDLEWVSSSREEALYLKLPTSADPGAVARYDLAARKLEGLDSPVFNLSPDGRYYFSRPAENVELGRCEPGQAEDSCFRLLERETNREIAFFSRVDIGRPHGWVYNDGHQLLVSKKTYRTEETERTVGAGTLRGNLITGVSGAQGLVFDVETQEVSERFDCDVSPRGWAGDWVTGALGIACRDSPRGTYVHTSIPDPAPAPPVEEPGPPAPATGAPGPGASFNYSNPIFSWQEAAGADSYAVEVCTAETCGAGEVVSEVSDLRETRWQPRSLPKGELFWRVASTDDAGRTGPPSAPVPFAVLSDVPDHTAPRGRLEAAAAGAAVGLKSFHPTDTPVEAAVEDELSGVKAWFPRINGRPGVPDDLLGPWTEPVVDIEVVGEDEAGNQGTAAAARLLVDSQPPEIRTRFVTPAALGGWVARPRDGRGSPLWVTDGHAPGLPLLPADRAGRYPVWSVESDVPHVFVVPGEGWPFSEPSEEQAGERRVLWIDAVDRGTGVVRLVVRVVAAAEGAGRVLRIEAADSFGNRDAVELALR